MLNGIEIKEHHILGDVQLSFSKESGTQFSTVLFVGENGCGKTSLLNELANYDKSKYIINKRKNYAACHDVHFSSLFISQDRKYREAINIISTAIFEKKVFPDCFGLSVNNIGDVSHGSNCLNNLLKEKLETLHNDRIAEFIKSDKTVDDSMIFLLNITKINDLAVDDLIDNYSSGEQELILRLAPLKNLDSKITTVIYDEPETGLHPKWQLQFLPMIKALCGINGEANRQLFIATHSENVLKSAIDDEDTLIIRMKREEDGIKCAPVQKGDRVLKCITFAELQYLIFDIASYEYVNELLGYLMERTETKKVKEIDEYIINSRYYKEEKHKKERQYGKITYSTLPIYIRNKYHHPEEVFDEINDAQLRDAIQLLRKIIVDVDSDGGR